MAKITVQGTDINIMSVNGEGFISLTDMHKTKDSDFFISDQLRNAILLNSWVYGKGFIILILIMANLQQLNEIGEYNGKNQCIG